MKKGLKKLAVVLVAGFALVGVGGTVAFASGALGFNIQENFDIVSTKLETISDMFGVQNATIGQLEADKEELDEEVDNLTGANNSLIDRNEALVIERDSAVTDREAYKTKLTNANSTLTTFNSEVGNTNGTKAKLTLALTLIEDLSTNLGTEVDLTELEDTLTDAEQDNTDLVKADELMEEVVTKAEAVINAQKAKEAPQE